MDEYAIVFYTLLEQANILAIEEHLASLSSKDRAKEETRLAAMGYNFGSVKENDKNELRKILE